MEFILRAYIYELFSLPEPSPQSTKIINTIGVRGKVFMYKIEVYNKGMGYCEHPSQSVSDQTIMYINIYILPVLIGFLWTFTGVLLSEVWLLFCTSFGGLFK